MMISAASQNDLDALSKKIDAAITFPTERVVDDGAPPKNNSKFNSAKEIVIHLNKSRDVFIKNPSRFQYSKKMIASAFPYFETIGKPKLLDDRKLYEAMLYAKIFADEWEYARNRIAYHGLVWVEMDLADSPDATSPSAALIRHDEIIYKARRYTIDLIREQYTLYRALFKEEVKKNLLESLSGPVLIPDSTKYVSDLKSSAAVSSNAPSNEHQKLAVMTEEMKKTLIDELSSFNLDLRLKQQFEFDLKLIADKDVLYWRDRLDSLRRFSNHAPISAVQSQELEQLRLKIAELEKKTASLHDAIHLDLSEKELISQNEFQGSISTDVSLKEGINPSPIAEGTNVSGKTQTNEEKFQEMLEEYSDWLTSDQILELLEKMIGKKAKKRSASVDNTIQETKTQEFGDLAGAKREIECEEESLPRRRSKRLKF